MLMLRNGDSRESPTPSPWATRHAWPQGFEQAIRARGSRSPGLRKVLPVVIQHDNHSWATHRPKSHGTSAPLSIRSPDAVVARSARNDRVSFFLFWGVFSARWAALAAVFSASRRPDWKLLVSTQYPVTSCNFPRPHVRRVFFLGPGGVRKRGAGQYTSDVGPLSLHLSQRVSFFYTCAGDQQRK